MGIYAGSRAEPKSDIKSTIHNNQRWLVVSVRSACQLRQEAGFVTYAGRQSSFLKLV
jgi:hypothetical protein